MSELAGFGAGAWIPERSRRMMLAEDAAARRAERHAEAARAERHEQAHDRALASYRAAQEARGEHVSAVALAMGEVAGRTVGDVFRSALAAADREDARAEAAARRREGSEEWIGADEPRIGRSDGWPSSSYQADRLIERAGQLHRDLVAFTARRNKTTFDDVMASR